MPSATARAVMVSQSSSNSPLSMPTATTMSANSEKLLSARLLRTLVRLRRPKSRPMR